MKNRDLTVGSITGGLWAFAVPLMLGNIMQQLYNLADIWIVGWYIGDNALATVGSSYTLITFRTSVIIGLSLGKGLCYIDIGILFMLYGCYRAVNKPLMSVILTILSLGTRVLLAYILSPVSTFGVMGIWVSIPIGSFRRTSPALDIIFCVNAAGTENKQGRCIR